MAKPSVNFADFTSCQRIGVHIMLGEGLDAASAGYRVGYGDASHFTREYKRLFRAPPVRDMEHLREGTTERMGQRAV